jgi:simple sugar transport system permease protein
MSKTKKSTGFDIKTLLNSIGIPTLIIGVFWIFIMILGVANGLKLPGMLGDGLKRFGRWGIMTLAMVLSIQSGIGPNFALPIGIVCGILAEICAMAWGFSGVGWLIAASILAIVFASLFGYAYGKLMNTVKGSEMSIATYSGFAAIFLFCVLWLTLPFKDQRMTWPLSERGGLRQTIQLDVINVAQILDNFMSFEIFGVSVPTGTLLVLTAACLIVWLFTRSKTGIAIAAGGSNPIFARAAGLNVDRGRIMATILSMVLGALGIIFYAQSYGYIQLYQDPLMFGFIAVAGVLIGGASVSRARIAHVIIGTLIFQGLMATSLPVANELFAGTDLAETLRAIIQNGIILYALMQAGGKSK